MPPRTARPWQVRLATAAQDDLTAIVRWTRAQFGSAQARRYRDTVLLALARLENGPNVRGSTTREDVEPGLRTLHVARTGRRGRHVLVYRAATDDTIEVARILHDAMDLQRHVRDQT